MSRDEWISRGLDFAKCADDSVAYGSSEALKWLERALRCFERGGRHDLAMRARTQMSAIKLRSSLMLQDEDRGVVSQGWYICPVLRVE